MKRIVFIILLCFMSCSQKQYQDYIPNTAQCIYDESHNNSWRFFDHGYCGYSTIAQFLKNYGIPPSITIKHLDECIQQCYRSGYTNTLLILSVAKYQQFDSGEVDALCNFVKKGGLLFVIAEHENMYNSAQFLNAVTTKLGIQINNDAAGNGSTPLQSIDNLNNSAYSKVFTLKNVLHMLAASLSGMNKTNSSFEILLCDGTTDKVIAAGCIYGKGRMLVVGDSEMFWNGDGKVGINAGDNRAFFKSCVEWLLKKRLNKIVHHTTNVRCFDPENSMVQIDNSCSGIQCFMDALKEKIPSITTDSNITIVVHPQPQFTVKEGKRTIVFIEPYQNLMSSTVWGNQLLKAGAVNPSVYVSFAKSAKIQILPAFITNGDSNYYMVTIAHDKNSLVFNSLAALLSHRSDGMLFKIPSAFWGEVAHPGLEVINDGIPMYQSSDYTDAGYMYADSKLLIVGDADAIANQNNNTQTFSAIVTMVTNWIQKGSL